jgi:hypothetical protein
MDAPQRAVVVPAAEIVVHCAARRQVLWQRGPLAARAQDIHQSVDDLPLDDGSLVPTPLGGRNEWSDNRPLAVGQVAGVA